MKIPSISTWLDQQGDSIHISEFLLEKSAFPSLYADDEEYFQQRLRDGFSDVECPVEQLSPKGLSLLCYLFSQKEKCESQPLVVSTVSDFENTVRLINNTAPGTKVTVVVQLTDPQNMRLEKIFFPALHKTVCKFEKEPTFLRMISLDGTNSMTYGLICQKLAKRAIGTEQDLRFISVRHAFIGHGPEFSRQRDQHSCGIFAIKDARQINRDCFFSGQEDPVESESTYPLPAKYLKNLQSLQFSKAILVVEGDTVVTRKQRTLAETHTRHHVGGYASHFSKKYRQQVLEFLAQNESNPAFIRQCTTHYDAGQLTPERLMHRYGPDAGQRSGLTC